MADVNWNLAVTPDPFKQIAEGADYSRRIFDQAALLQAGTQYAGGDYASAANTVARRGDFKTAGDLSDLATARTAGAQYAAGDYAGAGKTYAAAGKIDEAGKIQDQQIKTIQQQQDAIGRVGGFIAAANKQNPASIPQAWAMAKQQLQAAGIPPDRIADFEKLVTNDPAKAAATMGALSKLEGHQVGDDFVFTNALGQEVTRIKGVKAADQLRAANSPFNADGTPNLGYQQQQLDLRRAGRPETNVNVNTAAKPFFSDLGGLAAKQLDADRTAAQSAANAITASNEARALLDSGAFTGAFANWKLGAAKRLGLSDNEVANTEAFQSAM